MAQRPTLLALVAVLALGTPLVSLPAEAQGRSPLAMRQAEDADEPGAARTRIVLGGDGPQLTLPPPGLGTPSRPRPAVDLETVVLHHPSGATLTDEQLGLTNDPAFRTGVRLRLAGVIITSISLSAATVFAILSLTSYSDWQRRGGSGDGDLAALAMGMLSGISLAPSLVGVPLWAAGQSRISHLRAARRAALLPAVSVAAAPGGAALAAHWRF